MGVGAVNPVQVMVAAWPWGAYLCEEGLQKGIRAKVSSFTRMHVNVQMVRAKISGQYVNSFLANREAALSGYEEAILLDTEGYVAEGSGENIFLVKDGVLQTPPLSSPVLAGITRDSVLRIARDLGIPVKRGEVHARHHVPRRRALHDRHRRRGDPGARGGQPPHRQG